MDTTQWTQDIGLVTSMAAEIALPNVTCSRPASSLEKKVRPQKDQAVNCPRCNSTNTKFCYYNNYSLTQPRYFCKTCRRYWTAGGTLRNVPVGGGSRKNRRSSSLSLSSSSSSSQKLPDLNPNSSHYSHQNPNKINLGISSQDLNLGFPSIIHHDHNNYFHGVPQFLELPKMESSNNENKSDQLMGSYLMPTSTTSTSTSSSTTPISALDLLRTGMASRGLTSFISSPPPNLNAFSFSSGLQENGAKNIMFPFGCSLKQFSGTSTTEAEHHQSTKGQENSNAGYWNNGMFGGGSW